MANKQDIITAIKNLDLFLKVPELKDAKAKYNKNGSLFVYTGGFNMVFQLNKGNKKWAFRVWHVPMGDTKERYQSISKYLTKKKLPYFAKFIFDEKGILVNGELVDTIRMEWLDGLLFKEYVENNLSKPRLLAQLANNFLKMCHDLRENKISHGDLQEGNILIDKKGNIKLVDYDSICIPEIEGQKELVTGLRGYQHPSRFKGRKTSLKADYFSELIIYLSIISIAKKPELWNKYKVKSTQYLLFSENDFKDIKKSNIYNDLKGINQKIDKLLSTLVQYLGINNYTELVPLKGISAVGRVKKEKTVKILNEVTEKAVKAKSATARNEEATARKEVTIAKKEAAIARKEVTIARKEAEAIVEATAKTLAVAKKEVATARKETATARKETVAKSNYNYLTYLIIASLAAIITYFITLSFKEQGLNNLSTAINKLKQKTINLTKEKTKLSSEINLIRLVSKKEINKLNKQIKKLKNVSSKNNDYRKSTSRPLNIITTLKIDAKIRVGNSPLDNIIGNIKKGTEIKLIKLAGHGYWQINFKGRVGFINELYLNKTIEM